MSDSTYAPRRDFLLTVGGPTYRIEKRMGLIRENSPLILRRAALSVLLTWVPLLALTILQGNAIGHRVPVPFLRDFAVHARFLFAMPLLLAAETILGPQLAHTAIHFIHSGVVVEEDYPKFDEAIQKGLKWRDSTAVEVILVLLAYAMTATIQLSTAVHVSTWYAIFSQSGVSLTWSGWWLTLFCVPLFQFLILRWLWRQFLWAQFLWRMSKLNLLLMPTHPDEAGGLAFVGEAQRFFGVILLACSAALSGVLANEMIYDKIPLPHFAGLIAAYVVFAVCVVVAPLFVFAGKLLSTKRSGLHRYGTLATTYAASFHRKWILDPPPPAEPLLGTGDIQSLADLGNSFGFIEKMGPLPMGPRTPIHLVLACLIPMAPLLLTVMPLEEIVKLLFKIIL
jgi:hypothetical protein